MIEENCYSGFMSSSTPLRIAHISDLHFAAPTFSPWQFLSKQWIGNLNLLFSRRRQLDSSQVEKLIDLFLRLKIHCVLITGDLTTTTRTQELDQAARFVKNLREHGLQVIAIPGNHDHYTKNAWKKKLFYNFFPDYAESGFSLKEDGLAKIPLHPEWTLLALDTAYATSLISSQGHFQTKTEAALERALATIPPQHHVILMNHFPLFEHERPSKALLRAKELKSLILRHPCIRFYLHGHTHAHCIADLRASFYPIILDSGSTSDVKSGSWNFLEITAATASLQVYRTSSKKDTLCRQWNPSPSTSFSWPP